MNFYLAKLEEKCLKLLDEEKWQRAFEISIQVSEIKARTESFSVASDFISEFLSKLSVLMISMLEKERIKPIKQMLNRIAESFPNHPEVPNLLNKISIGFHRSERPQLAKKCILQGLRAPGAYKGTLLLNLSVILNDEKRYKEALKYTLEACKVLQEELMYMKLSDSPGQQDKITQLAIAYHNSAAIEESLRNMDKAMDWYAKSLDLIQNYGANLKDLDLVILRNINRAKARKDTPIRRTNSSFCNSNCYLRTSSTTSAIPRRNTIENYKSLNLSYKQTYKEVLPKVEQKNPNSRISAKKPERRKFMISRGRYPGIDRDKYRGLRDELGNKPSHKIERRGFSVSCQIEKSIQIKNKQKTVGFSNSIKQEIYSKEEEEYEISNASETEKNEISDHSPEKMPKFAKNMNYDDILRSQNTLKFEVFEDENPETEKKKPIPPDPDSNLDSEEEEEEENDEICSTEKQENTPETNEKDLMNSLNLVKDNTSNIDSLFAATQSTIEFNNTLYSQKDDNPHSIKPEEVVNNQSVLNLVYPEENLHVEPPEKNYVKVQTRYMTISGDKCRVSIYSTNLFNSIVVKAKRLKDGLIMKYSEDCLDTSTKGNLEFYIKRNVLDYLCIDSDSLTILSYRNRLHEYMIAKGTNHIHGYLYLIFIYYFSDRSQIFIEVTDSNFFFKGIFSLSYVLDTLDMPQEVFFEDPSILILAVNIEEYALRLQYQLFFRNSHDYLATRRFENRKYIVRMYTFTEEKEKTVFITANSEENYLIQPLKVTESHLRSIFINGITYKIYYDIAVSLRLKNDKLALNMGKMIENKSFQSDLLKLTNAVLTIQRAHRRRLKREIINLKSIKKQKQEQRKLIAKNVKKIGIHYYYIFIYQIPENILFECSPQGFPIIYFKLASEFECSKHEYANPSLIIERLSEEDDNLVVYNPNSNSCIPFRMLGNKPNLFSGIDKTYTKTIQGEKYSIKIEKNTDMQLAISLKKANSAKEYLKTFLIEEIQRKFRDFSTEKLVNSMTIKDEEIVMPVATRDNLNSPDKTKKQQGKTIILKTSKIQLPKIYLVTMSVLKQKEKIEGNDFLIFEAMLGASQAQPKELVMLLKEACECTGFSKDQLIPMGNFIIQHILVITPSAIEIDFSSPHIVDFNLCAQKIQTFYRQFKRRKNIKDTCYQLSNVSVSQPSQQFSNFIYMNRKKQANKQFVKDVLKFGFNLENEKWANSLNVNDESFDGILPATLLSSQNSQADDSYYDDE